MKSIPLRHTIAILIMFAAPFEIAHANPLKLYKDIAYPTFNSSMMMQSSPLGEDKKLRTLDIVGVGLAVEMFRQSDAWKQLQKNPENTFLPTNINAYPTNYTDKKLASNKRATDALEFGASYFVEGWPIPNLSVWPYCNKPELPVFGSDNGETNYSFFYDRIADVGGEAGMHHHKFTSLLSFFKNEPEEVLERAFRFFDDNPAAPALMVLVSDGDRTRGLVGDETRASFYAAGPRRPGSMAESFVLLMLARRDRVDALRKFVPTSSADKSAQFYTDRDKHLNAGKIDGAAPIFKPSKFVPAPWTAEQISQFDKLPTIAVIHRPVRITYRKDKDGKTTFDPAQQKSLMHDHEQQAAFKTGLDAALHDIPGGKPARVFFDAGGPANGRHLVPLSMAIHQSLPAFDLFNPTQGIDISERIGNTGASSPFVQWALAAIASHERLDTSMTVNLRQAEEATITVITPIVDNRIHPMGNPIDFNLAPQDGGPAIPVSPLPPR